MSRKRTSGSTAADGGLACPSCGRVYSADERFCPECAMPLVAAGGESAELPRSEAHERARKIRPELTRGELVRVAWARNQAEAELIQGFLLEEGVPSVMRRSGGFDVPDFMAGGPRDLLVPESAVEVARAALPAGEFAAAPERSPAADRSHVARVTGAVVGGGALAALVAWALVHLA